MASGTAAGAALHQILLERKELGEEIFAVVDSARDREMVRAARHHYRLEQYSLLGWETPDHMLPVVPYLIPLKYQAEYPYPGSAFLDLWASRLGRCNGILLVTPAHRQRLFDHLAEILEVEDHRGRSCFFRYYDPRILRVYLPTCTPPELGTFFGPVRGILVETTKPREVLAYSVTDGSLVSEELSLSRPTPS